MHALACRRDADVGGEAPPELYSGSADRTARVWDVHQRGYVETLYGHQEGVTALDALGDHIVLSVGEDRTVRLWKVAEETQLLFANGHDAPADACALLHAEGFVSGGQDGKLTLWSAKRKKALCTVPAAHGAAPWGGPCWISSLCAPAYSDMVISGACDGRIRTSAPTSRNQHRPAPCGCSADGAALASLRSRGGSAERSAIESRGGSRPVGSG